MRAVYVGGGVLVALAACGLVLQSFRITALEARLARLEDQALGAETVASASGPRRPGPHSVVGRRDDRAAIAAAVAGAVPSIAENPEMQAEVEAIVEEVQERTDIERREQFAAMMRENLLTEVDRFADEQGVDEPTADAVSRLLEDHFEGRRLRWEAVHDGEKSMSEARTEGEAEWETLSVEMTRLLGADRWSILEERVSFGPGRGPGRH